MKKLLSVALLLIGVATQAQSPKPSLFLEYSTRSFQNSSWVLDYYQPISVNGKWSLSSWNTYTTAIDNPNSSEYLTSINYLNRKVGKKITLSGGVQYLENRTFNFNVTTVNFKARLKLL